MTQTLPPGDTGEMRRNVGDATCNLAPYIAAMRPTLRRSDAATEVFDAIPATIGDVTPPSAESYGPPVPQPPRPLPPEPAPQPDGALERVAGPDETAVQTLLTSLGGEPGLRRSVLYVRPAGARGGPGRHRAPAPAWTLLLIGAGSALMVVALAVGVSLALVTR